MLEWYAGSTSSGNGPHHGGHAAQGEAILHVHPKGLSCFAGHVSFQGHYDLQLSEDAVPEDIRRGLVVP